MNIPRKIVVVTLGLAVAMTALEAVSLLSGGRVPSVATEAEARVGRPLTPVSVAGVARRTVRRCAVGVYNC